MEPERIELSAKERDRLKVVHEGEQGHLKQGEGGRRLRLSGREVRRLQARLRAEGDGAIVHGLRGRRSNRKIPEILAQRALRVLRRERYRGFGPTLAAEHLARQGLSVSRETLRQWMSAAGLWRPRSRRVKAVHVWRPRRAAFGELVMMDSSPYHWLEDRGPACHLVAMIDDASSRVWGRLLEHDSTAENLRTLGGWLVRHGLPLALYTDNNSLFHTSRPVQWQEALRADPARTQFGRALAELGIEWIAAHSPQAKGRIERLFGTLQDRLGEGVRLHAIRTPEPAHPFFEIAFWPFRPTAYRSRRSKTQSTKQDQNQIHPASRSPLEETLEADISIWQKTGHFYFALTELFTRCRGKMRMSGLCKVEMSGFI